MNAEDDTNLFINKKVSQDVKRKVLAEKKAYDIVKQLLEENIDKEYFKESVYFLTAQHYQDVIEERAILKICGYPLCDNPLKNIPSQQYRIASNRVFDLTQRKNFCCDRCYKASEHVKKQIPTLPLWLRDTEKIQSADLDSSGLGSIGEEVSILNRVLPEDDDVESSNSNEDDLENEDERSFGELDDEVPESFNEHPSSLQPSENFSSKRNRKKAGDTTEKKSNVLEKLLTVLKEWLSDRSFLLMGLIQAEKQANDAPSMEELRKLKKLQLLEKKLGQVVSGSSDKDSKKYEEEVMADYTRRVELFYRGKLSEKEMVRFKEVVEEKTFDKNAPIFPKIDSKNQDSIRRNILHQKLTKVSQDLFPHLPLEVTAHDLKELIHTFNLTSTNVVLKTNEYPLMIIITMHLMGRYNDFVRSQIDHSVSVLNHVLSIYQLKLSILKLRVDEVINQMLESR